MANKPIFYSPKNRNILTVSVSKSVSVYSPDDTTGSLYVDGVPNTSLTNDGIGNFTGTYAPGASVAASKSLTFVGDVTGTSDAIIITIDAANLTDQVMTGWTKSNVNIDACDGTSGKPDINSPGGNGKMYRITPTGSGSARRLFYKDPVGSGTEVCSGMEAWILMKSGSVTNFISYSPGSGAGIINPQTGQNSASNCHSTVVETITNYYGGMDAHRVQWRRIESASGGANNNYWDLMQDTQNTTFNLAGGDLAAAGIYMSEPRRVDDVKLPFTASDKLAAYIDDAASTALGVTGGKVLYYKHPYVDTDTAMAGGPGGVVVKMILPSGHNPALANYPVLFINLAQTDGAETGASHPTAWDTAKDATADYANTYNCVVVVTYERPSEGYWGGVFDNGSKNMWDFYPDVLLPYLIKNFGVSPDREDHLGSGYSKGANFWAGQILLKSYAWGQVGLADGAYLNTPLNNNADLNYGPTHTLYNAHDAYQQLTSNLPAVQGNARIALWGGYAWNTDLAAFKALLDANGINYSYSSTAWTYHGFGPTGINTGYYPVMVASMFANRARIKAARPKQSHFLMR
jgi:hypothetical protein